MESLNEPESEEIKSFLRESFKEMITELQRGQAEIMEIYKNNPTFPFDFYSLSLRESDTKITTVRELYRRIAKEELE